jgi:hypothetical protein
MTEPPDLKQERARLRAERAAEGKAAMAEYLKDGMKARSQLERLRALRRERDNAAKSDLKLRNS